VSLGKKEKAMYIKVDPPLYHFSYDLGAITGYELGTTLQEPNTLVLDLHPTEEEMLSAMHPKTRYNIRLAEKRGVQVRWSTSDDDHVQYLNLQKDTFSRQGIRLHPDRYYEVMFKALREAGTGELAVAELDGQPLAINLLVWSAQTAVFNHGGSSNDHKDVMAPYLLQWASIKRAKERGMNDYDFRGIAPANAPDHKLAGVTRFKLGFGGRRVVYPGALNAILDRPWWGMYRMAKKIRGGVDG
jgi:lipid II:glycine glycyltransferase (peptidoglycan interpeptide bridge formation enzyme)